LCTLLIVEYILIINLFEVYTTGIPFFADCRKQSAKALKQVAKALPTVLHVAVGKEHPAKILSAKKPLPPAKRKAVGKENERRCEMTELFADCISWQVAKSPLPTAFLGRWQRALCRLPFLAGGKGLFLKFFL